MRAIKCTTNKAIKTTLISLTIGNESLRCREDKKVFGFWHWLGSGCKGWNVAIEGWSRVETHWTSGHHSTGWIDV